MTKTQVSSSAIPSIMVQCVSIVIARKVSLAKIAQENVYVKMELNVHVSMEAVVACQDVRYI